MLCKRKPYNAAFESAGMLGKPYAICVRNLRTLYLYRENGKKTATVEFPISVFSRRQRDFFAKRIPRVPEHKSEKTHCRRSMHVHERKRLGCTGCKRKLAVNLFLFFTLLRSVPTVPFCRRASPCRLRHRLQSRGCPHDENRVREKSFP